MKALGLSVLELHSGVVKQDMDDTVNLSEYEMTNETDSQKLAREILELKYKLIYICPEKLGLDQ